MGRYADAFAQAMREAAAHVREGRLDEASRSFRRALRYQPNEWVALAHLGACERLAGRAAEAERVLLQALVVRPEEPGTLNELSLVAGASGRRAEAIDYLERATRAAPGFLQGWCNLGKLLYIDLMESPGDEARRARAVAAFERILALDPGQAEFGFLRDALTGARVQTPPEGYVAQFFDRFAATFEGKVAGGLRYSAPAVAAERLRGWLAGRDTLSVLDLGCGTGLSGQIVRHAAARLVGVDVSEGMLAHARALGIYDELVRADVVAYLAQSTPRSWDLVIALDVVIYVGALEAFVPAAARALAPGGRLILTVETAEGSAFELQATGRYAHSRDYVDGLAVAGGMEPVEAHAFHVREEAGRAIDALMLTYTKAPA